MTLFPYTTLFRSPVPPRVLPSFREDLSAYAKSALERLGVEVILNKPVIDVTADTVRFDDTILCANTIIWAAGVQASPAAAWLGAEADRAGRIKVEPDLTVPGSPDIFAIGDTVTVLAPNGKPVPGDRKSTRLNSSHHTTSRMPSSA